MLQPPIPGSQILAPRWASKGTEWGPSGRWGCPWTVSSASPADRAGHLSSLMFCCFAVLRK